MKTLVCTLLTMLLVHSMHAQQNGKMLTGCVRDIKTKKPVPYSTIRMRSLSLELISNSDGTFILTMSDNVRNDSIEVSHIGYRTYKGRTGTWQQGQNIYLEEHPVLLKAVTVGYQKLDVKEIDRFLRPVTPTLYAAETEVTNELYNLFLLYLEQNNEADLLKICDYDLSHFDEVTRTFYKEYTRPFRTALAKNDTSVKDYTKFPAVNISYEAATVFCQWLTEQYNIHTGRKKFTKVRFRLPTLQEWQIAALGYPRFQSWKLEENQVEVIIPADTLSAVTKGRKCTIPVNSDILYPWWSHYNYRKKVQNEKGCYLGNFRIPRNSTHCFDQRPGYDGWIKMARTRCYFSNGMGLYDVVGNVAEMVYEKGKVCGGSWNDLPAEATLHSVKNYTRPEDTIGFRVFMEIVSGPANN